MAPYETDDSTMDGEAPSGRRKAARYVVPFTVVGVAAATIGLVPALADSGDPDLPKISAQQLIEKMAKSDVQQLSGTVKISTDLGLPSLGGLESSLAPGGAAGGDSSADPASKLMELASGTHTLRVAADGPDKQKLSVLDKASEYSLIHNGDDVWAYDSASNEAFHSTGASAGSDDAQEEMPKDVPATPQELADEALKAVDDTTSVTVDGTAQVAGRDAYKLLIKPKQSGTTVGAITVAVDAKTGVPLKFTLVPASGGAAVVDAGFTEVSFAKPAASTFDFSPPKGTKVTEGDELEKRDHDSAKGPDAPKGPDASKGAGHDESREDLGKDLDGLKTIGEGWTTIVRLDGGEGAGAAGDSSSDELPADASRFLDSLGDKVSGKFGSGTVFSTRLVNALITDDGKVYAGAVTKDALVKAANADQ
ncbi:LolA family protein [Streptomyces cavernae]|uniref:LolA family protein n=1 Tax=Streptomyces cavernae TaxID=2259034 RepID=UPI001390848A|nr:outer membrane lipoprotein carrier protein LolA [Streptomyces cavernae]